MLWASSQGAHSAPPGGPGSRTAATGRHAAVPGRTQRGPHMLMLTPRQHAAYQYIAGSIEGRGIVPSYEELRLHLGLRSLNAVAKLVAQLRRRGALAPSPLNAKRSLSPVEWGRARSDRVARRGRGPERVAPTIPLLGIVAAGEPIEAIENPEPIE